MLHDIPIFPIRSSAIALHHVMQNENCTCTYMFHIENLFQIFTTVLAVAASVPLEDTVEVKAAKAEFAKAFAAAQAGKHAELAPSPTYLADLPDVAQARDEFRAVWDMYAAGEAQPVSISSF